MALALKNCHKKLCEQNKLSGNVIIVAFKKTMKDSFYLVISIPS